MSASLDVDWGGTGGRVHRGGAFHDPHACMVRGQGLRVSSRAPEAAQTARNHDGAWLLVPNPVLNDRGGGRHCEPGAQSPVPRLGRIGSVQHAVSEIDCRSPEFVNRFSCSTEFTVQTQTRNFDGEERTTVTINPGLIYMAEKYQIGVEAVIPVNRASGDDVGVIGNVHFFLEGILPRSLG